MMNCPQCKHHLGGFCFRGETMEEVSETWTCEHHCEHHEEIHECSRCLKPLRHEDAKLITFRDRSYPFCGEGSCRRRPKTTKVEECFV